MSENIASINSSAEPEIPSTEGITTKVVKGSLWTLAGTVLPFLASFISIPFVIRFLGTEAYGVLVLVMLIPTYFAFSDFGMGNASTKFASEAYAQGLRKKEGEIVRTAAFIAFLFSFPFTAALFLFSFPIVVFLKVPEYLQSQASAALKITAATFIFAILGGIFNTPQLARLRMDLNTFVNTSGKLIPAVGIPLVLYFGGSIVEAVSVALIAAILILLGHILVSGSLLKELFQTTINREIIKPMLKFGSGWMIAVVASILLVNLEKVFLTGMISVKSLAYYSVAFTFASMATMFSTAMIQSLVPAFSQLLAPEQRAQLDGLFSRSIRLNLIWLLPAVMFLFVIAKPFFTIWAGEDFGRESPIPFYILLSGLFFNILAFVPHSAITAVGRTDVFAKLYWIELFLYVFAVILLINSFGIVGAAMAWSMRVIADAFVIIWLARRIVGVSFKFTSHFANLIFGFLLLLPPMLFAAFYDNFSFWLIVLLPFSTALYALLIWKTFLEREEKIWIKTGIYKMLKLENRNSVK
ncbi:MAG TPA: flippase [Pyrinomonadaceae bacterium]|nr:flippase [Pyrinomonadaceae bacterium]